MNGGHNFECLQHFFGEIIHTAVYYQEIWHDSKLAAVSSVFLPKLWIYSPYSEWLF